MSTGSPDPTRMPDTPNPADPAASPHPTKPRRASKGTRIVGYLFAIAFSVFFLWLVNGGIAWREWEFISGDVNTIVEWINISLIVGILLNLVYIVWDPIPLRRLGDALTAALSFVVTFKILTVYPFTFTSADSFWEFALIGLLWLGLIGAAIGVVSNLYRFVKAMQR